jgi:tyrocidine synthetase-3
MMLNLKDEVEARYYEGLCEPFPYEPTEGVLKVITTEDKGQGVQSLCDFKVSEVVFKFWGRTLSEQTLFTLQKAPGVYIEDSIVMGKVLHSCDPNMACDMKTQTFTAIKPIKAGEYLTMDYETTEDELYRSFECGCGASACRGLIKGRAV